MRRYDGKTSVLVGVASGIGLGAARALLESDGNVVLADIDERRLRQAQELLAVGGDRVRLVSVDVREEASPRCPRATAHQAEGFVGDLPVRMSSSRTPTPSRIHPWGMM